MEQYIRDKLPLVNKFAYLKIIPGKKISDEIFDSNKTIGDMKSLLQKINNLDKKYIYKNYNKTIYNNIDEILELEDNNLSFSRMKHEDTKFLDNNLISLEIIEKDKYIFPSFDKNKNVKGKEYEIMEFNISQILLIYIKKNIADNKYNVEIRILRPNNPILILEILNQLIEK